MATVQTAIDPSYLTFTHWAEAMRLQNQNFPRPGGEPTWKDWARQVAEFDVDAPNPATFATWQSWALAWLRAV